jgi:iron(III) transport system substrate-binding protein
MRHSSILNMATAAIAAVALFSGPSAFAADQGKISGTTLVVYTPNEQAMLDSLVPGFESKSGVKVQVITAGTGELYQRIRSEASKPQGDVMFGGGAAQAETNIDLWEKYVSSEDAGMVDAGKNKTGAFTPYQADGSNLLVNTEAATAAKVTIASYVDLLKPELKGKIAFGDPTSSSSAFAQLTNMLKSVGGDYESDKGWDYVRKLVVQLNGVTISSSSQVAKDVAAGEYIVGLTYEPLSSNFVKSGAPVKIVYPSEGAAFLPATIQVIKGGPNQAAAKAFIDFIISEDGQKIIAEKTAGRPLRNGVVKPGLPALAEIRTVQEDGPYVAKHRAEIVAKYKKILEQAL